MLSMKLSGEITLIVVEISAFYYSLHYSIERIDVAGRDVSRHLRFLLRKEGHDFHRSSEFEIVREVWGGCIGLDCAFSVIPNK